MITNDQFTKINLVIKTIWFNVNCLIFQVSVFHLFPLLFGLSFLRKQEARKVVKKIPAHGRNDIRCYIYIL